MFEVLLVDSPGNCSVVLNFIASTGTGVGTCNNKGRIRRI